MARTRELLDTLVFQFISINGGLLTQLPLAVNLKIHVDDSAAASDPTAWSITPYD